MVPLKTGENMGWFAGNRIQRIPSRTGSRTQSMWVEREVAYVLVGMGQCGSFPSNPTVPDPMCEQLLKESFH